MTARFTNHLAAPPGEWINDPNGLVFADGHYHLYVQHSAASPAFKEIGWGHATSSDLLNWEWIGVAIPPDNGVSAYSGSIAATAPFEVFLTRHDANGGDPVQSQWRATSLDGRAWRFDDAPVGSAGSDVRDPFVFFCAATNDWRMLIAQPCGWLTWADDAPSTTVVWRSDDRRTWTEVGRIGPWSAQGVMWEVPVLLDFGERQVLIVSTIDRFDDSSRCAVRAWAGWFDGTTFVRDDAAGGLLDLGPDFYALCPNTVDGWPEDMRLAVAWASSWRTARTTRWPGGANGGPITLPRTLTMEAGTLCQRIARIAQGRRLTSWNFDRTAFSQTFIGPHGRVELSVSADGTLTASRRTDNLHDDWDLLEQVTLSSGSKIDIYLDAGLIELSFNQLGRVLTVYLEGARLK